MARHSETLEPMVIYRPADGTGGAWARPPPCGLTPCRRAAPSCAAFQSWARHRPGILAGKGYPFPLKMPLWSSTLPKRGLSKEKGLWSQRALSKKKPLQGRAMPPQNAACRANFLSSPPRPHRGCFALCAQGVRESLKAVRGQSAVQAGAAPRRRVSACGQRASSPV